MVVLRVCTCGGVEGVPVVVLRVCTCGGVEGVPVVVLRVCTCGGGTLLQLLGEVVQEGAPARRRTQRL